MNTITVLANEWFPVIKVLCIIGAVVAFFVSLYQWRRGQRIRKSEFLSELMAKFTSSEIATTYYEYIERKTKCFYKGLSSEGEPVFTSEADERAVDRLLGFMSYVCYLYENRLIDKDEFSLFVYQLNAVLSDEDIRRYMADLRAYLPANYPYEYLARYVERCDLRQMSKNAAPSQATVSAPVCELTKTKFIDYLISTFGGMTASAQSVKARVKTVRTQLGVSLDNMVKDEASTRRTLERIDTEMTDKCYNVRANLKNAVRHCYQAKHGKRFGTYPQTGKNFGASAKGLATFAIAIGITFAAVITKAQETVPNLSYVKSPFADLTNERVGTSGGAERIKEIFKLAKESEEEDGNINFCGFFTGMSRHDAVALAEYYHLKPEEYKIESAFDKSVHDIWFSLKSVRRITKGGNSFDELAQAVANRVGELKGVIDSERETIAVWKYETIDGVVVTMSKGGLRIKCASAMTKMPVETASAKKERLDVPQETTQSVISTIIRDMVAVPEKDFLIGKYEVTQRQWGAVMDTWGNCILNPIRKDHPVEYASWSDCHEFIKRLNALHEVKASGLVFRLPTAAEWEYACRAGSTGDYCKLVDGREITSKTVNEVAWYGGLGTKDKGSHPVGSKKPNAFGLYDMHGNVREWCKGNPNSNQGDEPLSRVLMGGGHDDLPGSCKSSSWSDVPDEYGDDFRMDAYGIRLAASKSGNR